jgi:hypothetical protein
MPSPKLIPLVLTDDERRRTGGAGARRGKTSQALVERAKIVLACAESTGTEPVTAIAARFGVEVIRLTRRPEGPVTKSGRGIVNILDAFDHTGTVWSAAQLAQWCWTGSLARPGTARPRIGIHR